MKKDCFLRITYCREALYARCFNSIWTDDKEVLLQLSVFSATLKPLWSETYFS